MDVDAPRLVDGRILVHPRMRELWAQIVGLGVIAAPRSADVGGQQVPLSVYTLASAYLMAGNLSAYGYAGLTQGAAHLLQAFGSDELRAQYMTRMYRGEWTGTMALTEPQAGSSLSDVATIAEPAPDGSYRIRGNKIFISGGDQDITENVVHINWNRWFGSSQIGSSWLSASAAEASASFTRQSIAVRTADACAHGGTRFDKIGQAFDAGASAVCARRSIKRSISLSTSSK